MGVGVGVGEDEGEGVGVRVRVYIILSPSPIPHPLIDTHLRYNYARDGTGLPTSSKIRAKCLQVPVSSMDSGI